jgi:hypothetical protein
LGSGSRKVKTNVGCTNYQLGFFCNQSALRVILKAVLILVLVRKNLFRQVVQVAMPGYLYYLCWLFWLGTCCAKLNYWWGTVL